MPRNSGALSLDALASVAVDGPRMVDPGCSWSNNVSAAAAEKYRKGLTVIRGDLSPSFRGRRRGRRTRTAAELALDNRLHTDFVRMQAADGTVPSTGFEDIRRRRQHPWRVLARRIVEAHAVGVPKSAVASAIDTLRTWVDQLYATSGETVTERVTLYQSPFQLIA